MLTALSLAVALQVPHLTDPYPVDLGKLRIGTREVSLRLPAPGPALSGGIVAGEWKLFPRMGIRALSDGLWGDTATLYARHKAEAEKAPEWKVRVFIFTRSETIDLGSDQLYRQNRAGFEKSQVDEIYESLARTKAMAEAWTGGKAKLTFQVTIDEDPIRIWRDSRFSNQEDGKSWMERTIGPLINGAPFDADDGIDRGPYKSVWVVRPSSVPSPTSIVMRGMPVRTFAYYDHPFFEEVGGLSRTLYRAWIQDASYAASKAGYYGTEDSDATDPMTVGTPAMWDDIVRPTTPAQFEERRRTFLSKPLIRGMELPNSDPPGTKYVWVNLNMAQGLADAGWGTPKGFRYENGQFVRADKSPVQGFWRVSFPEKEFPPISPESYLWQKVPSASGLWSVESTSPIRVKEVGNYRAGKVRFAQFPNGIDVSTPMLQLNLEVSSTEPLELRFVGRQGVMRRVAINVPDYIGPKDGGLVCLPLDTKKVFVLDLRETLAKANGEKIYALELAPESSARLQERGRFGASTYTIWDAQWLPASEGLVESKLDFVPADPETAELRSIRSAASQNQARVLELAKSPKEFVRLNALQMLRYFEDPTIEALLLSQAASGNAAIAYEAISKIESLGEERAIPLLKRIVGIGPFDFSRQFAAEKLAYWPELNLAATISSLITARSVNTRIAAARAIAQLKGDQAKVVLVALLQDIDPRVTFEVMKLLDPSFELANRRALQSAINDPSEAVRMESYRLLLKSSIEEYVKEGLKGVRDESIWIQKAVLKMIEERKQSSDRSAVLLAVTDSKTEIRAEAFRILTIYPEPVRLEEIENLLRDPDPSVQSILVELAIRTKLILPADVKKLLQESISPIVRSRAKELP